MQRVVRAQSGWRHWTGRVLPVLAVALLALGPAHAKDKKKKKDSDVPAQVEAPAQPDPPQAADPPQPSDVPKPGEAPKLGGLPALGMREQPRAAQSVSLDRVISQVERRYKARVVRVDKTQKGDRLVYVLRLLSEEGRVWTVKIDAETGKEV